jgi:hypothetical protein
MKETPERLEPDALPPGNARVGAPAGSRKVSVGMVIASVFWLGLVSGATVLMTRYSNSPGGGGQAPKSWPSDSQIPLASHQPTLVMFVHPHCPCSRASLGELERFLSSARRRVSACVVFLRPTGTEPDWEKTDLWRKALSIAGVTVRGDEGGIETQRFHVETSGQTLLYGPDGKLSFEGGITLARGHSGDNPGRAALEELVREGHSDRSRTPIFGCGLVDAQCQKQSALCKP